MKHFGAAWSCGKSPVFVHVATTHLMRHAWRLRRTSQRLGAIRLSKMFVSQHVHIQDALLGRAYHWRQNRALRSPPAASRIPANNQYLRRLTRTVTVHTMSPAQLSSLMSWEMPIELNVECRPSKSQHKLLRTYLPRSLTRHLGNSTTQELDSL